jgi:hypothetical protein
VAGKDFRGDYRKNSGRTRQEARRYTIHRTSPLDRNYDARVGVKVFLERILDALNNITSFKKVVLQ